MTPFTFIIFLMCVCVCVCVCVCILVPLGQYNKMVKNGGACEQQKFISHNSGD